ncbi:MAG: 50S ribosomal protein L19 [bacterium]|nr:50S ribosomal protein L19 [bacterium]
MTDILIKELEKKQMKENVPEFNVGDTVEVSKIILEGKKKRVQKYEGVVTRKQGNLSRENFTVRKVIDGIGVEKTFLLHSPLITDIKVKRQGKVRRSKLYYLRNRIGAKASRIKAKT